MPRQPIAENSKSEGGIFRGFASPTSNTTYTPNQFFDVCLPHCSRGCIRLVAMMLRQTLGWCDKEGNPQTVQHRFSWDDFERAGISRQMIPGVLQEAIEGGFVSVIRHAVQQKAGQPAVSGIYELKWDEGSTYRKDPRGFLGFFAGEGNRTYIPNQFFDEVVPRETLAVTKLVGSVIRFSIGFQTKWGHRRQNVSLSYQHIQNYSLIKDRTTLSDAIRTAMQRNYIERVIDGYFDPDAGKLSRAAVYSVKWLTVAPDARNGQKTRPAELTAKTRSKIPTGNGQKNPPDERSENPTDIEIKQKNKTLKQKEMSPEAAASFEKLKEIGFDDSAARAIASTYTYLEIERQIDWLDYRNIRSNRLGMLRRAIEEDWKRPESAPIRFGKLGQPNTSALGETFAAAIRNIERRLSDSSSKL